MVVERFVEGEYDDREEEGKEVLLEFLEFLEHRNLVGGGGGETTKRGGRVRKGSLRVQIFVVIFGKF